MPQHQDQAQGQYGPHPARVLTIVSSTRICVFFFSFLNRITEQLLVFHELLMGNLTMFCQRGEGVFRLIKFLLFTEKQFEKFSN